MERQLACGIQQENDRAEHLPYLMQWWADFNMQSILLGLKQPADVIDLEQHRA